MELALLIALAVLQGLTLYGVGWLWWRRRQEGDREAQRLGNEWSREMRSMERYIENKVDLLLAQILSQKPQSLDLKELVTALRPRDDGASKEGVEPKAARAAAKEETEPEAATPLHLDRLPQIPRRKEDSLSPERRLARVLSDSSFLVGVWPEMDGLFEEALAKLHDYLAEKDLPEPAIEPHPPIENGGSNHWLFMTVAYRDPQTECRRFLIPRNYSRYDPLVHDHLFNVLGASGSVDLFVRELRECALLEANGELKGFIPRDLVAKKGVFVV